MRHLGLSNAFDGVKIAFCSHYAALAHVMLFSAHNRVYTIAGCKLYKLKDSSFNSKKGLIKKRGQLKRELQIFLSSLRVTWDCITRLKSLQELKRLRMFLR